MDLMMWIGKRITIEVSNGYYYTGKCINADEDSIQIIDKNGKDVSLTKQVITLIKECYNGN